MDKSDEYGPDEGPDRTELRRRTFALASMSKTTSFLLEEKTSSKFSVREESSIQVINEMKNYSIVPVSPMAFNSQSSFSLYVLFLTLCMVS